MVNTLPTEPSWAGKRVNYGKDRCAYIPKSQQAAAQQAQAAAAQSLVAQQAMSPQQANFSFTPYGGASFTPVDMMNAGNMANGMGGVQAMNRTVYLGNIHPETTPEDLCNAIRGGVLQSIRYMQDKHIAVCVLGLDLYFKLTCLVCLVRYICRPCRCVHLLPGGLVSGSYLEQPPPEDRVGQKLGPSATHSRSGSSLGSDQECLHRQRGGLRDIHRR